MAEQDPGRNKGANRGPEGVYAIEVADDGRGGFDFRGECLRQNRQRHTHAKCRNQQAHEKDDRQEHGRVRQRAPSHIQKVVIEPFTAEGEEGDDRFGEAEGEEAIPG